MRFYEDKKNRKFIFHLLKLENKMIFVKKNLFYVFIPNNMFFSWIFDSDLDRFGVVIECCR